MYCVYCGVKLQDGAGECPLCHTPVVCPTAQESESTNGIVTYTCAPFEFKNKNPDNDNKTNIQTTQVVQNGETLELISNPANLDNKFFYGWYVVAFEGTDAAGNIIYKWTDSPKHLAFETPIAVTDNGDGTFTMTWTDVDTEYSETAEAQMDSDGTQDYSAHIYVAPVYEDYYFVNFHELAYAVASTGNNLLTRKLVVLGDDKKEDVLVSNVVGYPTDPIRKIFRGWQYKIGDTWVNCQTVDDHGEIISYSIEVNETSGNVDMYPYYQEGRWLYFNVGDSGNGARYVPAQFELAEFNEQTGEASTGGVVTQLPVTERVGYDFGGWRVITNDDLDDPVFQLVTDAYGNFLPNIDISKTETYEDNDGNPHTGVAYTIKDGKLTIKYPLSSLTFYAQWNEKANSKYTVVVWKQKVTDSPDAIKTPEEYAVDLAAYLQANPSKEEADFLSEHHDEYKFYDYYALPDGIADMIDSASGRNLSQIYEDLGNGRPFLNLENNASTSRDFIGFDLSQMGDSSTPGVSMTTANVQGDGSTVVNVYYDRNKHQLYFGTDSTYTYVANDNGLFGKSESSYFQIYEGNGDYYDLSTSNNNNNPYTGASVCARINNQWYIVTPDFYSGYEYYSVVNGNRGSQLYWKKYTGQRYGLTAPAFYTITALYGQNISKIFYEEPLNTYTAQGYTWQDINKTTYTQILSTIETMPDSDVYFVGTNNGTDKTVFYYC